jgi:GMP synthase-like glutamine amidotransferase
MNGPALILQHGDWGPPGLLADWLESRGLPFVIHRSWLGEPLPDPDGHAFVASLGSNRNPRDTDDPAVAAELELLARAVERNVPVLGLCFGGQALAAALGAPVEPAPVPELGWVQIETDDPDLVPAGPWLAWHYERFRVPPGAREIARSRHASQAFVHGPHLGVQFHPESTVDIVAGWARSETDRLAELGVKDGLALLKAPPEQLRGAAEAAFRLFDAFLARARDLRSTDPAAAAAG